MLRVTIPTNGQVAQETLQTQQIANVTRTYGATGTIPTANLSAQVSLDPNAASTDAFGRLRVSSPDYRFDGQLTYGVPSDLFDAAWNSSGTVTFDRTNRLAVVSCAAPGTAVLQSHKYAPYTPGRSQLAFITFIMGDVPAAGTTRRVGYFDGSNGIYLEHAPTGVNLVLASSTSLGNQTVAQASWNIDKMDGNGPSGLVLDLSKVQILAINLQALYAGRVVVGFDINGALWPVHQFNHANIVGSPYIALASLPVRYEAASTGTNPTSLSALCASVMSEGGGSLASIPGRTFSVGATSPVSVTSRRPLLSIRANKFHNSLPNSAVLLANTVSVASTTQAVYVELVRNATSLTGASWSNVDPNSVAQYDVSATALTGGSVLYSMVVGSGAGATQMALDSNLLDRLIITYSHLLDQADTLTIVATSTAATTPVTTALVWKEIR